MCRRHCQTSNLLGLQALCWTSKPRFARSRRQSKWSRSRGRRLPGQPPLMTSRQSSMDSQMLAPMPPDLSAYLRLPLWGMGVVQTVWTVWPGQLWHLLSTLLLTFHTDLGQDELASRVAWMLALRQDIANFICERVPQGHLAVWSPTEILSAVLLVTYRSGLRKHRMDKPVLG